MPEETERALWIFFWSYTCLPFSFLCDRFSRNIILCKKVDLISNKIEEKNKYLSFVGNKSSFLYELLYKCIHFILYVDVLTKYLIFFGACDIIS